MECIQFRRRTFGRGGNISAKCIFVERRGKKDTARNGTAVKQQFWANTNSCYAQQGQLEREGAIPKDVGDL
jgi:hypothetical protein